MSSKRLSQFYLYNNHDYRGIVEMAAMFRAEQILKDPPGEDDEARRLMADDILNDTSGRGGRATSRLARSFMNDNNLMQQGITGDVVHPNGIKDDLIDWLTDRHWDAVAEAVYGDLVTPELEGETPENSDE